MNKSFTKLLKEIIIYIYMDKVECKYCKTTVKKIKEHEKTKKHIINKEKYDRWWNNAKLYEHLKGNAVKSFNTEYKKAVNDTLGKILCNDLIDEIVSYTGGFNSRSCFHKCSGNMFLHKCCECMDKRCKETVYTGYKDGVGVVEVYRNTYYCDDCKERTNKN